jgi:hypothetical protein
VPESRPTNQGVGSSNLSGRAISVRVLARASVRRLASLVQNQVVDADDSIARLHTNIRRLNPRRHRLRER